MRSRKLVGAFAVLGLVLILLWLLRPKRQELGALRQDSYLHESNQPSPIEVSADASVPSHTTAPGETQRTASSSLSNLVDIWKHQNHVPVEFYGKVVDENEQPLAGATVLFTCSWVVPSEGSRNSRTVTDKNGSFAFSGAIGRTLSVEVTKAGYYPMRRLNTNGFDYVGHDSDPFRPVPGEPVLFHLRKKGEGTELITSRHGVYPDIEVRGLTNGTPLRVDFFRRTISSEGQIELSAVKPPVGQPATEWSFRMSIPGGGFVEHNDEFPFEAPQSGYQPTIEFYFKAGAANWTQHLHKSYYIVFGQPPRYGWIEIETKSYTPVFLKYAINPNGARYLEPKNPTSKPRELPPGVTEIKPPG